MKRSLRILVVDDAEDMRSLLSDLFRSEGHEVVTAGDRRSAEAVLREPFDLAVLDYQIPLEDRATSLPSKAHGNAVMKAADKAGLTFVVLTGVAFEPEDGFDARDAGAAAYLKKSAPDVEQRLLKLARDLAEKRRRAQPKSLGLPLEAERYEDCAVALSAGGDSVTIYANKSGRRVRLTPKDRLMGALFHLAVAQAAKESCGFEQHGNASTRRSLALEVRRWLRECFHVPGKHERGAPLPNDRASSGWICQVRLINALDVRDAHDRLEQFREAADRRAREFDN